MDLESIKTIVLTAIGSVGGIGGIVAIICRLINIIGNLKEKKYLTKYKAEVNEVIDNGINNLVNVLNDKTKTKLSVDISKYLNQAVIEQLELQKEINASLENKLRELCDYQAVWMEILSSDFKGLSNESKTKLRETISKIQLTSEPMLLLETKERIIETIELEEPIVLKQQEVTPKENKKFSYTA